jgi:hypothetical protein
MRNKKTLLDIYEYINGIKGIFRVIKNSEISCHESMRVNVHHGTSGTRYTYESAIQVKNMVPWERC